MFSGPSGGCGPPGAGGPPPPGGGGPSGGGWKQGGSQSGLPGYSAITGMPNVFGVGGSVGMYAPTAPMFTAPTPKLMSKLELIKLNDNNWVLWSSCAYAVLIEMSLDLA